MLCNSRSETQTQQHKNSNLRASRSSIPALPFAKALSLNSKKRPECDKVPKKPSKLPVSCRVCEFQSSDIKAIISHDHGMEPVIYRCLLCNEREISTELVQNHIKSHPYTTTDTIDK